MATDDSQKWLRAFAFILSVPSGAVLLAKIYGLAQMHVTVPYIVLPSCLGILLLWIIACRRGLVLLATTLSIGFVSGLLGTLAYDLYRWPYQLAGYRIFIPIQVYGVWSLNTKSSSSLSDFIGWVYHFSNGLTFAIAYTLVARKWHWIWGIAYALGLETIAVVTPFARIFSLSGNYPSLFIAYSGHIAYGLPIALMTWRWDATVRWLSSIPAWAYKFIFGISILIVGGLFVSSLPSRNLAPSSAGQLVIKGAVIEPEIISVSRNDSLTIHNDGEQAVQITVQGQAQTLNLSGNQTQSLAFSSTGIFQVRVLTTSKTRSGFVIVEPVHAIGK